MTYFYNSPIGFIKIETTDKGICSLIFVEEKELSQKPEVDVYDYKSWSAPTTKAVGSRLVTKIEPTASVVGLQKNETSWTFDTASCLSQLDDYFQGKRTTFDLPLDLQGTEFQKRVWAELMKIPFGKTITYKELSLRLGNLKAIRAVGAANGANPVSIIVPCHRVIGSDGSLTGYAGGLWRKKWLLDFESYSPNLPISLLSITLPTG